MKNKLFFLATLFIIYLNTNAQKSDYLPLLDTGKVWYTVRIGEFGYIDAFNMTPDYEDVYNANDTIYYGIDGFIIVREDTTEKKVYSRNFADNTIPTGPEELLYDFSLQEGDSVFIKNDAVFNYNSWFYLDSVKIINIFGVERRNYFLKNIEYNFYPVWIEGIGSLSGIYVVGVEPILFEWGELTCCYHNDTLLYQSSNGAYWGCSFEHVDVKDIKREVLEIKLYPNPVTDVSIFTFNNALNEEYTIKIFDILGKQIDIQTTQSSEFYIYKDQLSPGIYFYLLIKENQIIYSNDFLVQ